MLRYLLFALALHPLTAVAATIASGCPDEAEQTRLAPEFKAGWSRAERYEERYDAVYFLNVPDAPSHCLVIVSLSNGVWKGAGADHHLIELVPEGGEWKRDAVQVNAFSAGVGGHGPRPGVVQIVNGHRVVEFRTSSMNHGEGQEWVILVAQIEGAYRKVFEGAVSGTIAAPPMYDETGHIEAGVRFLGGPAELPDLELFGTYTQTTSDPDDPDKEPTNRVVHTSKTYRLLDGEYQRIDCDDCEPRTQ